MDPLVAGSAINAASGIIGNVFGASQTDKNNQANLQLWREQTAYNTPKKQMERYKEAGLNPHLIYGQGGGGGAGNAGPAPLQEKKSLDLSSIGNAVNQYLELKKKDREIENLDYKNSSDRAKAIMDNYVSGTQYEEYTPNNTPPFVKKFESDLNNAGVTRENKQADTGNKAQDLKIKKMGEYVPEAEKERWEKYQILPSDDKETQFLKMVAKDIFGTTWEKSREKILDMFRPSKK